MADSTVVEKYLQENGPFNPVQPVLRDIPKFSRKSHKRQGLGQGGFVFQRLLRLHYLS